MTRLMVWNIQRFTIKKLRNLTDKDSKGKTPDDPQKRLAQAFENTGNALFRRWHILRNIKDANPDIFIVIEVQSKQGKLGTPVEGGGQKGSLYLLELLREMDPNADWCLVPPLKLVDRFVVAGNLIQSERQYTEAIAVFYKNQALDFIGPWIWPKEQDLQKLNGLPEPWDSFAELPIVPVPPKIRQVDITRSPYPKPWDTALPPGNYYAGQYRFPYTDQSSPNYRQEILFTEKNNRRPYLTKFMERDGQKRAITVLTSHPSPGVNAKTAMTRLIGVSGIKPGQNEVVVLPGDFNVDFIGSNSVEKAAIGLVEWDFTINLNDGGNTHGPTILKEVRQATPTDYLGKQALDNILTRPKGKKDAAIIDRVKGQPFCTDMLCELDFYKNPPKNFSSLWTEDFILSSFRSISSYGHIAHYMGVSDHLPLMIDL